jgi:antirestriction protein ArdC
MADEKDGKRDHRQEVTNEIISMLEKGTAPWQKPWDRDAAASAFEMPTNATTGRAYRGGNALFLMARGQQRGYDDPRWLTFKQAQENGAKVNKGEKGTHVEAWVFEEEKTVTRPDGSKGKVVEKLDRPKVYHHVVFNAAQTTGLPPREVPAMKPDWEVKEAAENILTRSGASIQHSQTDRAYYSPGKDEIHLPPKQAFKTESQYYSTALHELGHWTGHGSRLNREGITGGHSFGSDGYAKEELRAELSSVFLQKELGIPHDTEQHAAYVKSWVKVLREDKNEIFRAAAEASKITDYVVELGKEKTQQLDGEKKPEQEKPAKQATERTTTKNEVIELNTLGAVAYIDQKSKEVTIEPKTPEAGKAIQDKDREASKAKGGITLGQPLDPMTKMSFERGNASALVADWMKVQGVAPGEAEALGKLATKADKGFAFEKGTERLKESFAAAKTQVEKELGTGAKLFIPKDDAQYKGVFIGTSENGGHHIQKIGDKTAVAHIATKFKEPPTAGHPHAVTYKAGKVVGVQKVQEAPARSKALER